MLGHFCAVLPNFTVEVRVLQKLVMQSACVVEFQLVRYMSCCGMTVKCCEKVFWLLAVLTMATKTMFSQCFLLVYGLRKHDRDRKRDKEWIWAKKKRMKQTTGCHRTRQNCRWYPKVIGILRSPPKLWL